MTTEQDRELEITLESALMLVAPGITTPDLAERIYNSEPELMKRLQKPWMIERLIWMLHRKRRKIRPANQLSLPGFERLPQRLKLPDGRFARLKQATLKQLRLHRQFLSKRKDPRLAQLSALIDLVQPHAQKRPGITVFEVMQAEQAKLERK